MESGRFFKRLAGGHLFWQLLRINTDVASDLLKPRFKEVLNNPDG